MAKAAQYVPVEALLVESQRRIARVTSVAWMTIANRLKKAQRKEWKILKLDEWWSFMSHRNRKAWWLAVDWA